MKIRMQCRDTNSGTWETSTAQVNQIPELGEFLALAPRKVYRVVLTLHIMFAADYDAEVFAERVNFEDVQRDSLGDVVWQQ